MNFLCIFFQLNDILPVAGRPALRKMLQVWPHQCIATQLPNLCARYASQWRQAHQTPSPPCPLDSPFSRNHPPMLPTLSVLQFSPGSTMYCVNPALFWYTKLHHLTLVGVKLYLPFLGPPSQLISNNLNAHLSHCYLDSLPYLPIASVDRFHYPLVTPLRNSTVHWSWSP